VKNVELKSIEEIKKGVKKLEIRNFVELLFVQRTCVPKR